MSGAKRRGRKRGAAPVAGAPRDAEVDVLVVGSGSTATLLAHGLLSRGVARVRVIGPVYEDMAEGLPVLRAGTIAALTEAGLWSLLAPACEPLRRVLIRHDGPGGWEDEAVVGGAGGGAGPGAGPVLVDWIRFHLALRGPVGALGGVYTGLVDLLALEVDAGGVTARLKHLALGHAGDRETVRARFAVWTGDDVEAVRAHTGLGLVPDPSRRSAELSGEAWPRRPLAPGAAGLWIGAGGHVAVVPQASGVVGVAACAPDPGGQSWEMAALPALRAALDWVGGGHVFDAFQASRLQRGAAPCLRAGRVLLAGDAAHRTAGSDGHDAGLGVADALTLAPRLAAVLGGTAPEGVLDVWADERRAAARAMLRLTDAVCEQALVAGRPHEAGALVLGHRAVPVDGALKAGPRWHLVPPDAGGGGAP